MRYQPLLQQQLIPHHSKLECFATVTITGEWHFCEATFARSDICMKWHLCKATFVRSDICVKQHLREATFAESDICAKQHFLEATFVRSDICAKQHLCEATFAWSDICVKWHFPKATFAWKTLVRSDEVTLAQSRPLLLGATFKVASATSPSLAPRWLELRWLLPFMTYASLAHELL